MIAIVQNVPFYFFEYYPVLVMFETCPTSDAHTQKKRKAPKRKFAFLFGALVVLGVLHHLRHETAHGLGGFVLLLPSGVGVGA